ncbi:HAD-IIIC family phosphatase [Polynucleobacter sphagniphilus]|uniref:HAD-IIIC family phosphatase n=1 Tax=Polynucleobacter sphagniphilus TaxID=1743169 RepID=UPI00240716B3|nr:HAD-IIIC family phosphatase [Polynucleobacter sphagniphilus]MDF9787832.1 FkbH-like protein [Polynucleobacter sphagniphilus]
MTENIKIQEAINRVGKERNIANYSALEALLDDLPDASLERIRVSIARNFTVEPLIPILKGEFARCGFLADIYLGDFDVVASEILNKNSGLYSHNPQILLIANWLEGISKVLTTEYLSSSAEDVDREINRVVDEIEGFISTFRANSNAPVLINNFPLIDLPTLGILNAQLESGHTAAILKLNKELLNRLKIIPDVFIVDYFSIFAKVGTNQGYDERYWHIARAPLKREMLLALGLEYVKYVRALKGKGKKCLVLDCDNTLWGGVIGEDGIDGIKLGTSHPGSGFSAFQTEIVNLYNRGVLLALCSKNNEEDVLEVLDKHPDMILRRDHIAAWQINWDDKASNLSRLAEKLNIGIDSFVFVDDNAFECEWVESQLPQVAVVHLKGDSSSFKRQITDNGFFDTLSFTEEDKKRSEMYISAAKSEELKNNSGSYDEYLRNLKLCAEIGAPSDATIPRFSQLTQKTNQFNLTTIRYSEGDISRMLADSSYGVYYLKLQDRFTDLGLIGVAITKADQDVCNIDTFALSCRALGRGVEDAFIAHILGQAKLKGFKKVAGVYIPTKKNAQVADFYGKQGFKKIETNGEVNRWEWNFEEKAAPLAPEWIELCLTTESK